MAGQPVPRLPPAAWHDLLTVRWRARSEMPPRFRIIRTDARRAIVMVDQRTQGLARAAWNAEIRADDGREYRIATARCWGTLVGAKAWFRTPLT